MNAKELYHELANQGSETIAKRKELNAQGIFLPLSRIVLIVKLEKITSEFFNNKKNN